MELRDIRNAVDAVARKRLRATGWEPELCYGRHRGPRIVGARPAAVLILLCPDESDCWIPLIERPPEMPVHGGQVALPGGGCRRGEAPVQCAVREAQEELGVPPGDLEILGELPPVYVFSSHFLVHPIIASTSRAPVFRPCPREVARVLRVSTRQLAGSPRPHTTLIRKRGFAIRAPSIPLEEIRVWGATSVILGHLAQALRQPPRAGNPAR